jgi:RHS repeat-associated protein
VNGPLSPTLIHTTTRRPGSTDIAVQHPCGKPLGRWPVRQAIDRLRCARGCTTPLHFKRLRHYQYDPFGNTIRMTGTGTIAKDNPFRFSTKRTDDNTDLVLYEYRPYSPSLGNWISRDPIAEDGGMNLYAFAANAPIDRIDPDGRESYIPITDPRQGNPVAIPDLWQMTGIPCGRRIRDEVWGMHGIGKPKWDPTDGSAREAHCIAHCRITRECPGEEVTSYLGGLSKEILDQIKRWRGGGGDGFDSGDMAANARGRQCGRTPGKACEELCKGVR